jgi:mono/diheme cytochrome c family protein
MRKHVPHAIGLALLMALWSGSGLAADKKIDIGQREYQSNCVACHGVSGKGDGPVAQVLKVQVPDLTVMTKKNGGVFPFARVYESIDGRVQYLAHGTREMPIWGNTYKAGGVPEHDDYPYNAEFFVRSRILALIDYLNRMQAR